MTARNCFSHGHALHREALVTSKNYLLEKLSNRRYISISLNMVVLLRKTGSQDLSIVKSRKRLFIVSHYKWKRNCHFIPLLTVNKFEEVEQELPFKGIQPDSSKPSTIQKLLHSGTQGSTAFLLVVDVGCSRYDTFYHFSLYIRYSSWMETRRMTLPPAT